MSVTALPRPRAFPDSGSVRAAIVDFLAQKRLAFVGLSSNERHFSRSVYAVLRGAGYEIVPVNPRATEIDGLRCYRTVGDIAPPVDGALIMTPAQRALEVLEQCDRAGIGRVWLHRGAGMGSVTERALAYCAEHSLSVVPGECPLMFVGDPPDAVHRGHAMAKRLSGTYATREPGGLNAALFAYGAFGWALCGAVMYAGMVALPLEAAIVLHALAAPLIFASLTRRYYRRRSMPRPLALAASLLLTTVALDVAVVALLVERSFAMFSSIAGTWLPFALIFLASWAVGRRMRARRSAV